jgi:hypothetical protein
MSKVYVVSRRLYKRAYYAEPFSSESIVKIFSDYQKAVNYICESFERDHEIITNHNDTKYVTTYDPNFDNCLDGYYLKSVSYDNCDYHESICYKLTAYDVE